MEIVRPKVLDGYFKHANSSKHPYQQGSYIKYTHSFYGIFTPPTHTHTNTNTLPYARIWMNVQRESFILGFNFYWGMVAPIYYLRQIHITYNAHGNYNLMKVFQKMQSIFLTFNFFSFKSVLVLILDLKITFFFQISP